MAHEPEKLGIYCENTSKYIEPLKAVLVLSGNFDLLPEIYDIFGKENTIKFLSIFAGRTIRIPTKQEFDDAVRSVMIWVSVGKNNSKENVSSIGSKFGISKNEVLRIAAKVDNLMRTYQVRLKGL